MVDQLPGFIQGTYVATAGVTAWFENHPAKARHVPEVVGRVNFPATVGVRTLRCSRTQRMHGLKDNVIGLIRIFPFWVVDPERLRCRAEPCKEKRDTLFSFKTLTRFCEGGPNTSPFRGSVVAVMNLDRVAESSGDHRVFDAVTMRSNTKSVSEAVGPQPLTSGLVFSH